uniref:Putative secreted protein n=1 Tax=Anopheles darlingi TaxID=43151 RepID=A0A2M4D0E6_ANODA
MLLRLLLMMLLLLLLLGINLHRVRGRNDAILSQNSTHCAWRDARVGHLVALLLGRHHQAERLVLLGIGFARFGRWRQTERIDRGRRTGRSTATEGLVHRVVERGGRYRVHGLRSLRRLVQRCLSAIDR